MEIFICEYCKKEFKSIYSLAAHKGHCKLIPNKLQRDYVTPGVKGRKTRLQNIQKKIKEGDENIIYRQVKESIKCNCKKCGKEYYITTTRYLFDKGKYNHYCSISCRNSHGKHSQNTKEKISQSLKTSEKVEAIKKQALFNRLHKIFYCKECGKRFCMDNNRNITSKIYCSKECKHNYLSKHTGGYRIGSGHGKQGWYKGIHCDSSWELAFVIYCFDKGFNIERCKEGRKYIYNGIEHTYFPDFIVNGQIVEIKGYSTEQWKSKEIQNPDIKVIYKDEIKKYLDYVINRYGGDFIKMYEK